MKKINIFAFSLLFLCSSCSSQVSALSDRLTHFTAFLKTKAIEYLEDPANENRVAYTPAEFFGAADDEFIPLNREEINSKITDIPIPQPSATPGAKNSPIPSIQMFSNPNSILAAIFKKIYFNTDQYSPKTATAKKDLQKIANYLKKNPNTFIFIEGHCDERASESYNLALGTKRAGTIRKILVNYGVNPNQLYTISYGKEKPAVKGKSKDVYAKNRRVAFKLYSKK
ncbi:MAG: Peptidoglycan-associated lipoprotein [Chlamydiia bacterium]|nr:Peptidoglycan-associated lipoprotein [Chlamydiia bacterium]